MPNLSIKWAPYPRTYTWWLMWDDPDIIGRIISNWGYNPNQWSYGSLRAHLVYVDILLEDLRA